MGTIYYFAVTILSPRNMSASSIYNVATIYLINFFHVWGSILIHTKGQLFRICKTLESCQQLNPTAGLIVDSAADVLLSSQPRASRRAWTNCCPPASNMMRNYACVAAHQGHIKSTQRRSAPASLQLCEPFVAPPDE